MEQDKRMELEEKIKLLVVEVNAHQSCGPSLELLKQMEHKINKDYVPKKEVIKLKTEQERKISKVKIESERRLADKFQDLNKLLSKQVCCSENYVGYFWCNNIYIAFILSSFSDESTRKT